LRDNDAVSYTILYGAPPERGQATFLERIE
jgi:hypothetical protein